MKLKNYKSKFIKKLDVVSNKSQSLIKEINSKKNKYTGELTNLFTDINFIKPSQWLQNIQDKLEQSIKTRPEEVVLSQSRYWARAITWTLMGGTTFGILWLCIAKTEEIVVATGKLEPISGVVDVQMPLEGIASEILVKEGEIVSKGQTLIKLDTDISKAKQESRQKSLEINQIILDKIKILVKEGAATELQLLQQQNKIAEINSQIKESEVTLRYQKIISPVSGKVFDLKPKTPGFVARSSEPVLKIVPNDNLKAKIEIPSKSIGFVSVGKLADISIDSFPASDFGVVEGVVTRIGSDALPPDPSQGLGYRFPSDITLNTQVLKMKSGKKLNLPLQAGMSLTANIKLRKVSYIQLLLNNFSDKADSLRSL